MFEVSFADEDQWPSARAGAIELPEPEEQQIWDLTVAERPVEHADR